MSLARTGVRRRERAAGMGCVRYAPCFPIALAGPRPEMHGDPGGLNSTLDDDMTDSFLVSVTKGVDRPRTRGGPRSLTSGVLALLPEGGDPAPTLRRAMCLGRGLGVRLHLLRISFESAGLRSLLRASAGARLQRVVRASGPQQLSGTVAELLTERRHLVSQVARYSTELQADIIVLPPWRVGLGRLVTSLACRSGAAVLVAREPAASDTILAATDLESPSYPVLRTASEIGCSLDARLVAVHNVNPCCVFVGAGSSWPDVLLLPADPGRAARIEHLDWACETLPARAQPVIRDEVSIVNAILDEAQVQDADLVVVGARERGWWQRPFSGAAAARVVDRARHSVLVTPIADAEPGASTLLSWLEHPSPGLAASV